MFFAVFLRVPRIDHVIFLHVSEVRVFSRPRETQTIRNHRTIIELVCLDSLYFQRPRLLLHVEGQSVGQSVFLSNSKDDIPLLLHEETVVPFFSISTSSFCTKSQPFSCTQTLPVHQASLLGSYSTTTSRAAESLCLVHSITSRMFSF